MSRDDQDDDYEVGYGKPPKHTQFQKGQSGNPKGRPTGARGFSASLKRELETKIRVREDGREILISKAEALAKRLVEKALKGDMKAISMLAEVDADIAREIEAKAATDVASRQPGSDDLDILRHFAKQVRTGDWDPDQGEDKT